MRDFAPVAKQKSGKGPRTSKKRIALRKRMERERYEELQAQRRRGKRHNKEEGMSKGETDRLMELLTKENRRHRQMGR